MTHTLSTVLPGNTVPLTRLENDPTTRKRLMELGFTQGESVTVLRNSHHDPMVIQIRETMLALDRDVAGQVMIEM